jgi:hypothetical protein
MITILLILLASHIAYGSAIGDTEDSGIICEVEPEMYLHSRPAITGRHIVIVTWRMVSYRAEGLQLFFTLVFDRDTNTPETPIYALQGSNGDQARTNHENAEEWAALQLQSISPFMLNSPTQGGTPIRSREHTPSSRSRIILPPAPPLERQTALGHHHRMPNATEFPVAEQLQEGKIPVEFSPRRGVFPGSDSSR